MNIYDEMTKIGVIPVVKIEDPSDTFPLGT